MTKRLVQLVILGLMLAFPLMLGCKHEVQAEEVIAEPVKHVISVEPITVHIVIEHEEEVIVEETVIEIDEEELDLLAHLIYAEAGSDWCSDKMQQYVGSVVLNRIASKYFPNTMKEVIYQKGQYSCTWNGMIDYDYNDRALECARFLLENGSQLPSNVIFQAQFEQGDGLYEKVQNMYFCYKGEE